MKDLMGMMKQVRDMQTRMEKVQAELVAMDIEGHSGGGLVTVTLNGKEVELTTEVDRFGNRVRLIVNPRNGKGEMRRVSIDPSLIKPEEAEILEDLIVAATHDARSKVEEAMQAKMAEVTGGLPIPPGLKLF